MHTMAHLHCSPTAACQPALQQRFEHSCRLTANSKQQLRHFGAISSSCRTHARLRQQQQHGRQHQHHQHAALKIDREVQPDTSAPQHTGQLNPAGEASTAAGQHAAWVWEESDDGAAAYAAFFLWLALGSWPALQGLGLADLPYFLGLGVLTVYIGAHRGLTSKSRQQLTVKEGALAPVLASVSLFGIYLVLKYFPDLSLQTFLDAYFWLLGTAAITGAARPLLKRVTGPWGKPSMQFDVPEGLLLDDDGKSIEQVRLSPSDILAAAVAIGLASTELASHHTIFTLNNMVACLVATEILALVGLRSFRTAALLLVGLLAYDVFWVFGSPTVVGENVMLQVATSDIIVGPTRLLFPRAPGGVGEAADFPYSLLGLGDIAIPGLLAGLALRFDAATAATAATTATATAATAATATALGSAIASATPLAESESSSHATAAASSNGSSSDGSASSSSRSSDGTPAAAAAAEAEAVVPQSVLKQRPYFVNVAAAHVAGLLAAFAANSITHLGQPALLYIVPATLLTVLGTAAAKGDVARVWQFNDVPSFGVAALVVGDKKKEE